MRRESNLLDQFRLQRGTQGANGADAAPDCATASALLAEHQLGAEAEEALVLAIEAALTT